MIRHVLVGAAASLAFTAAAFSAEPIEGTWKRPTTGVLIKYSASGGGEFCGTVMTGEYKGQSIGCMSGSGNSYKGKVNKLDEGKTYSGTAKINGDSMKLSGCVAMVLCKSETLARQ